MKKLLRLLLNRVNPERTLSHSIVELYIDNTITHEEYLSLLRYVRTKHLNDAVNIPMKINYLEFIVSNMECYEVN